MRRLTRALMLAGVIAVVAGNAFAACANPAGAAGQMRYASNGGVMVFCDGTSWISMAGAVDGGGGGATTLDGLTDVDTSGVSVGQAILYDGANWVASTTVDTRIGTLTNTKWCTSDGSKVICATDAPITTEADPEVGALTASNFCQVNVGGTAIVCGNSASAQRTALGLGTMAVQNANAVAISGGSITGLTSLTVSGIVTATYFEGDGSRLTGIATTAVASSTGAVQFNAGSGVLGGDTDNLFWDNAGKKLGVGTTTPSQALEVSGSLRIADSNTSADTCPDGAKVGNIRLNPITGMPEMCRP